MQLQVARAREHRAAVVDLLQNSDQIGGRAHSGKVVDGCDMASAILLFHIDWQAEVDIRARRVDVVVCCSCIQLDLWLLDMWSAVVLLRPAPRFRVALGVQLARQSPWARTKRTLYLCNDTECF